MKFLWHPIMTLIESDSSDSELAEEPSEEEGNGPAPSKSSDMGALIDSFEQVTANPEKFLSHGEMSSSAKDLLKRMFDFSLPYDSDQLNELHVDGFDDEQIWQQIELSNCNVKNYVTPLARFVAKRDQVLFPIELNSEDDGALSSDDDELDPLREDKQETEDEFDESASDEEGKLTSDEEAHLDDSGRILEGEENHSAEEAEDKFLKLSQMDEYLDKLEAEDEKGGAAGGEFDYFEDNFSGSEEEKAMYDDFFADPSSKPTEDKGLKKKVKFNLTGSDEDSDEIATESDSGDEENDEANKSSLERRQENIKKKIEELEEEALEPKSWQMVGEATATTRPVNSLLEECVEFDVARRPAPVVTEQTTLQLEDIIKQIIKDKAFDDVERKIKPVVTPHEFKKKLVLDQEKSKLSLAEIYEKEYLQQKENVEKPGDKEEVEPEEHTAIRTAMDSLFTKLDALSNYNYTPKLTRPNIKVVENKSAISLEEVGPEATAEARLLAPEEISRESKRALLGKDERTKTDKKRERRKKKAHQAFKYKHKTNQLAKNELPDVKNLKHRRQISKLENEGTAIKSSKDFFSRLQDTTTGGGWKRKKQQVTNNAAKKFKL